MLKLVNIKKCYKTSEEIVEALKGVNLEFKKNEFVAILGPSGCGKTTLLNIVGGLDKYDDGDLIINGKSTKEYSDRDWDCYRNYMIGFVFQNYNLIPHLSVLENVELALTLSGMSKNKRRKKAKEALEKVGLKDKINKNPNQLSGGQMQRVAIARAIVNDPDVILADEPTGSLDSKTSIQIMEILKEIAKEKLVIMVTHNPKLAKSYASRTISLLDGEVKDDKSEIEMVESNEFGEVSSKKTSMSFFTALSLSFKNLFTKKFRTILTSLAASIGVMGVAVVLSLSSGLSKIIEKLQNDTLSTYPLTISNENTINLNDLSSTINSVGVDLEIYPDLKQIYVHKANLSIDNLVSENNITQKYIDEVIENIDKSLVNGIRYERDMEINLFTNSGAMKQISNGNEMHVKLVTDYIWQQMLDNEKFTLSQYDVIEGKLPSGYNEVALVVDRYNRLTDTTMTALGLYSDGQNKKVYSFEELMNIELKLLSNDEMYYWNGNNFNLDGVYLSGHPMVTKEAYDKGIDINVVGIIRANEDSVSGAYRQGVVYSSSLVDYILEKNKNSSLARYMEENVNINPFTGVEYLPVSTSETVEEQYENALKKYGVDDTPTSIYIYPKNYDAKEEIRLYLDNYNNQQNKNKKIIYMDVMAVIIDIIKFVVNGISNVMITISSVSLIVSSILIAIITYISVIERTREIGVLRSIGARKKDIIRVFNAETFIIGLTSGLIGVCMGALITIPINKIMGTLVVGMGSVADLSFNYAVMLVAISVCLTIISGFIPAIMASKKNPVEALRSNI